MHPAAAIISVGAGNIYGHPNQATLDRLAAVGATVYRTDLEGTIRVTSAGSTYQVTYGPETTATATPTIPLTETPTRIPVT